jgi:hypothetical protein
MTINLAKEVERLLESGREWVIFADAKSAALETTQQHTSCIIPLLRRASEGVRVRRNGNGSSHESSSPLYDVALGHLYLLCCLRVDARFIFRRAGSAFIGAASF